MFQNLCGMENYKNVVILTSFWDCVDVEEGLSREAQLKSKVMKDLVAGGACLMRFNRTIESAQRVLNHILNLPPMHVQIQQEIRVEGKSLEDTAAGSVHREEVERIIAKHKEEIRDLRAELGKLKEVDRSLRREIEEERGKLQQELIGWEAERSALRTSLNGAKKSPKQLEMGAVKEKGEREKAHRELESRSEQFDAQEEAHAAALQKGNKGEKQGAMTFPSSSTKKGYTRELYDFALFPQLVMELGRAIAKERGIQVCVFRQVSSLSGTHSAGVRNLRDLRLRSPLTNHRDDICRPKHIVLYTETRA